MTIISDLLHAGVAPDLVARVADAIEAARSEGVDMSLRAMRSEGAERQARYRERKRNVTSDVKSDVISDVTSDATPSRARAFTLGEEVDITPLGSLRSPTLPKGSNTPKGNRLPDEWQAGEAELAFGRNLGLSDAQIRDEQGQFKDFWRGIPGQRGRKLDWEATFRNRLRDVAARAQLRKSSNGKRSLVDAGRELTERLIAERREREMRAGNRVDDGDPPFRLLPGLGR
jgi:hypothetical protein